MELNSVRLVAAKAIIRNRSGDVLVLQQSDEAAVSNAGLWGVPGGIVEPQETVRQAVVREVKEETGQDISVGKLLDIGEWEATIRGNRFIFVGLFFECHMQSDDIKIDPAESKSYRWVNFNDMVSIKMVEPARTIVEQILQQP